MDELLPVAKKNGRISTKFITRIVDTSNEFMTGVSNNGDKFITGVNNNGYKTSDTNFYKKVHKNSK